MASDERMTREYSLVTSAAMVGSLGSSSAAAALLRAITQLENPITEAQLGLQRLFDLLPLPVPALHRKVDLGLLQPAHPAITGQPAKPIQPPAGLQPPPWADQDRDFDR